MYQVRKGSQRKKSKKRKDPFCRVDLQRRAETHFFSVIIILLGLVVGIVVLVSALKQVFLLGLAGGILVLVGKFAKAYIAIFRD